jgi:hypothetical protein
MTGEGVASALLSCNQGQTENDQADTGNQPSQQAATYLLLHGFTMDLFISDMHEWLIAFAPQIDIAASAPAMIGIGAEQLPGHGTV